MRNRKEDRPWEHYATSVGAARDAKHQLVSSKHALKLS
jgi:hypothetical protein